MKTIINRIKQLESQLNDPEILDKNRIEIKLETFKECLQMVLNEETVKRENECECKNISANQDIAVCLDCGKTFQID